MSARYAVYFAPARHSPWWEFGSRWLGRDEEDGAFREQPLLSGISPAELAAITAEPRRYGFHATLKAPFRLADGHDAAGLAQRLAQLARTLTPLALGPLKATLLDRFVALVPAEAPAPLQALAAQCVTALDDLRAPLSAADLARRRIESLDPRAAELLQCYGYPHVMERFRLHLTLTGPVDMAMAQRVIDAAAPSIAQLNSEAPLVLDRLCLFVETGPGAPFLRLAEFRLGS